MNSIPSTEKTTADKVGAQAAGPISLTAPVTAIQALRIACRMQGFDPDQAELIRQAENTIYRLPGGVVARVTRPDHLEVAAREITVSRWLQARDFPVVQALTGIDHPIDAAGRAVTFWHELPDHSPGTPTQTGTLLRRLHSMDPTGITLPTTDPFVQVETRINTLDFLTDTDRQYLLDRAAALRRQYTALPHGDAISLVHGDPWAGNIVTTAAGPVMLDLERFSIGPCEYDLTVIAAAHTSYGMLTTKHYNELATAYGRDITTWEHYPLLRDIRELRVTTYAGQVALDHPHTQDQAIHRIHCLQGHHGPRPWPGWHAVP